MDLQQNCNDLFHIKKLNVIILLKNCARVSTGKAVSGSQALELSNTPSEKSNIIYRSSRIHFKCLLLCSKKSTKLQVKYKL